MNASELLKILEGVPDEVFPARLLEWLKTFGAPAKGYTGSEEVSEAAAVGAMVAWLTSRIALMISFDPDECVDKECRWTIIAGDNESDSETAHGATLLEALAAACRAVAKEPAPAGDGTGEGR